MSEQPQETHPTQDGPAPAEETAPAVEQQSPPAELAASEARPHPVEADEPAVAEPAEADEPAVAKPAEADEPGEADEPAEVDETIETTEPPVAQENPAVALSDDAPQSDAGVETAQTDTVDAVEPTPEPVVPSPEPSEVLEPGAPEPTPEPVTPEPTPEPVTPEPTPEPVTPEPTREPVVPSPQPSEVPEPGVPETPSEPTTAHEPAPEAEADVPIAPVTPAPASPDSPASTPRPAAPRPGPIPSPAALARRKPAVKPAPSAASPSATSHSLSFGRVAEDGTVFVKDGDEERAVGSYPEATHEEALAYFARKYDELAATATLLEQRLGQTDLSAHEARESLKSLRDQIGEANVVGDLPALRERVTAIEAAVKDRQRSETEQRAKAKAEATTVREALVAEAEKLAAADVHQIQWKSASARMRGMLDEWRGLQKKGPKLDKDVENALWQRLSTARSAFDKARKAFFSELDTQHAEAKRAKEKLVAEAEALSTSKDWGPTAGAFKRLMQDWRRAGRAQRSDDDALWERFKAAQDHFFNAKDEVVAAENEGFRENLTAKEELLTQAEALVPVKDLESAKAALRTIQEKWDEVGKVPREDMSRVEGRLRKVEQAVRDLDDARWSRSNPELNARAQSMAEQLERAVQGLEQDLQAAQASGDDARVAAAQAALDARRQLLDAARGGLSEFGS